MNKVAIVYSLISICYVFGCSINENTQNSDLTNTSWIVTSMIGNDLDYNLGDSLNLSLGITFLSNRDANISGVCNGGLSNYRSYTNGAFSF